MPWGPELLVIAGIIVLLFGAKKLPELAKSMGQSKAAFDEGVAEGAPVAEDSGEDKVEEPDSEGDDEDDDEGGDDGSDYDESHNPSGGGFG